jgi:hypothetical protein
LHDLAAGVEEANACSFQRLEYSFAKKKRRKETSISAVLVKKTTLCEYQASFSLAEIVARHHGNM